MSTSTYDAEHEKKALMPYANRKGLDEHVLQVQTYLDILCLLTCIHLFCKWTTKAPFSQGKCAG